MALDMAEQTVSTETTKYVPLSERSEKDLRILAYKLGLKFAPNLGREKMAEAIAIEQTKQQLRIEDEARLQLQQERATALGIKSHTGRKPSFEEVAINGGEFNGVTYPKSKKVLVRFINDQDRGTPLLFNKGGISIHVFEYDKNKNPLVNVMPECLISKDKKFETISLVQRGLPVFGNVTDPATGQTVSRIVGREPRFTFIVQGDAPEDAPFGLYLDKKGVQNEPNKTD